VTPDRCLSLIVRGTCVDFLMFHASFGTAHPEKGGRGTGSRGRLLYVTLSISFEVRHRAFHPPIDRLLNHRLLQDDAAS
jgi:hypothetical protein